MGKTVASTDGEEPLLLGGTDDTVTDTLVLLVSGNLLAGVLDLKKKLQSLDRGDSCYRDGS